MEWSNGRRGVPRLGAQASARLGREMGVLEFSVSKPISAQGTLEGPHTSCPKLVLLKALSQTLQLDTHLQSHDSGKYGL